MWGVKKLVIGSNRTWKLRQINIVQVNNLKLMMIRVQEQDNNANGYLDLNISSIGKHSRWESVTCGSPLARVSAAILELVSTAGRSLVATKWTLGENHRVNIVLSIALQVPNTSLYLHSYICACVVALVIS